MTPRAARGFRGDVFSAKGRLKKVGNFFRTPLRKAVKL